MKMEQKEIKEIIGLADVEYNKRKAGQKNRYHELEKLVLKNKDDSGLMKAFASFCAKKVKSEAVLPDDQTRFAVFAFEFGNIDGLALNWAEAVKICCLYDEIISEDTLAAILGGAVTDGSVSQEEIRKLILKMISLGQFEVLINTAPRTAISYRELIDEYLDYLGLIKRPATDEELESLVTLAQEAAENEDEDYLTKLKKAIFATGNSYAIKGLIGIPGIDNVEVVNHITSLDVLQTVAATNYKMDPEQKRELHNAVLDRMLEVRSPEMKNFENCLVYCVYADPEKFAGLITTAENAEKVVKIVVEADRTDEEKIAILLPYAEIFAKNGNETQNMNFVAVYFELSEKLDLKPILPNILKIKNPDYAIALADQLINKFKVSTNPQKDEEKAALNSLVSAVVLNGTEEQNYNMALIDGWFIEHARAIKNPQLIKKLAQIAASKGDNEAAEFLISLAEALNKSADKGPRVK